MNSAAKKAILAVSVGTGSAHAMEASIGAIEDELRKAFPDHDIRRALTGRTLAKMRKDRGASEADGVQEALERLIDEDFSSVIVQPTHIICGQGYDEMMKLCAPYEKRFRSIKYGMPLLASADDCKAAARAAAAEIPEIKDDDTAVVFVGHGTKCPAGAVYMEFERQFAAAGYKNIFVGAVRAYADMERVKKKLMKNGTSRVIIIPLMVCAGVHAENDICSENGSSWYAELRNDGYEVSAIKKGFGEYAGIREIYVKHVNKTIERNEWS